MVFAQKDFHIIFIYDNIVKIIIKNRPTKTTVDFEG